MAYSIDWLIKYEIILMQYRGLITVDELTASLATTKSMINSSPERMVHIISDVGAINQGISVVETIRMVRSLGMHPRTGWNITLREKSILSQMGAAFSRSMHQVRYKTFETLEEALDHLKEFDEPVTWSNLDRRLIAALPPQLYSRHRA